MTFHVKQAGFLPSRWISASAVSAALLTALLMSLSLSALAQDQAQSQRAIRVARISLIEGEVSYQRGDDKNTDWFDATVNTPLDEKDQVYSGRNARAEIQFSGRTLARIDRDTNLRVTQFNTSTIQLAQSIGTATYNVDSLDRRQFHVYDVKSGSIDDPLYFEVDTPAVAVTFLKEGNYRINVRDDGTTEVIVRKGQAEVYNQELGTIPVKSGRRIIIEGRDVGYYQIARLNDKDGWDRWNDRRDDDLFSRVDSYRSTQYVPASVAGVYDLDRHGDWFYTPEYGYVWSPRGVAAGWAPYRAGYWRWHGGWGWTWTSYEPWGWAPYHYGRWTYWRSRWCWSPYINIGVGGIGVGFWDWSPHLVAFFGWGGGYGRGYRDGYYDGYRNGRYGWLGWCPLGIGERWGGGYYGRGTRIINNTVIVNNTTHVRSIDSLRNYNSPNGVSGMDGRRFDQPRVVAENFSLPPRGTGRMLADNNTGGNPGSRDNEGRTLELARAEVLKPTQGEIVRTLPVERNSPVARAIEAPVVARRAPTGEVSGMPIRNGANRDVAPAGPGRVVRDGQSVTVPPERSAPTREGSLNTSPNRDASREGTLEGVTRPERRAPDFKPAERVERPAVTRPSSEDRSAPRRSNESNDSGSVFSAPRDRNMPRDEAPRRNERYESPSRTPERTEAPRQIERPIERPPVERREPPQRAPERYEAPREQRMPSRESAPSRDTAPPRSMERPSTPERSAPPRESAPPARAPERNSSPERSMPSRKPDSL
jgi:hypothetical protein